MRSSICITFAVRKHHHPGLAEMAGLTLTDVRLLVAILAFLTALLHLLAK